MCSVNSHLLSDRSNELYSLVFLQRATRQAAIYRKLIYNKPTAVRLYIDALKGAGVEKPGTATSQRETTQMSVLLDRGFKGQISHMHYKGW